MYIYIYVYVCIGTYIIPRTPSWEDSHFADLAVHLSPCEFRKHSSSRSLRQLAKAAAVSWYAQSPY